MYRPNFCSECGAKIIHLHWHPWTSRRFCDSCAHGLRKERLKLPLLAAATLIIVGFVSGRITRPAPPPLIIERSAISPRYNQQNLDPGIKSHPATARAEPATQNAHEAAPEEVVYICGARTKKGTPCSRRMHNPVRCWQHKGMPAMLPAEKLVVKG